MEELVTFLTTWGKKSEQSRPLQTSWDERLEEVSVKLSLFKKKNPTHDNKLLHRVQFLCLESAKVQITASDAPFQLANASHFQSSRNRPRLELLAYFRGFPARPVISRPRVFHSSRNFTRRLHGEGLNAAQRRRHRGDLCWVFETLGSLLVNHSFPETPQFQSHECPKKSWRLQRKMQPTFQISPLPVNLSVAYFGFANRTDRAHSKSPRTSKPLCASDSWRA